jgi:hypothetical protein
MFPAALSCNSFAVVGLVLLVGGLCGYTGFLLMVLVLAKVFS